MKTCFELPSIDTPLSVAIGSFDGLHRGHLEVIQNAKEAAEEHGAQTMVFSFLNHPLSHLNPSGSPRLLTSPHEKQHLLSDLGIDYLVLLPFSEMLSGLSPEQFVKTVLCETLNLRSVSVGYNFRFGKGAQGNTETLTQLGETLGFQVNVVAPYCVNEDPVSSTLIRSLISEGKMREAEALLGRPYYIQGQVVRGQGIATDILGVPTANIDWRSEEKALPPGGVYACEILMPGLQEKRQGILNLGMRPTFEGLSLSLESYIFDFEGDLYDQELGVYFKKYMRPEQRFDGPEALKEQIQKDIEYTRQFFS